MKQEVFNQYVDRVVSLFRIERQELFTKSKRRDLVDARHLLYYLCSKRPMRINYIQRYMNENGYDIKHSSIIHGIAAIEERIKHDRDYVTIVKEVERAVSI